MEITSGQCLHGRTHHAAAEQQGSLGKTLRKKEILLCPCGWKSPTESESGCLHDRKYHATVEQQGFT